MNSGRIRIFCLATLAIAFAGNAGAKNLAQMAASLLRDIVTGYSPARADDGKYHIVVLYNEKRLSDASLQAGDVDYQQEKVELSDVYTELARIDATARKRIQCVILVDLEPQQIIAAQQFARDRRVVIASVILPFATAIDRGSIPFVFDVPQQVAMTRSAAVKSYGLRLTSFPPKGVSELTRESRFRDVDICPPLLPDDQGAYPYVACHDNAFHRIDDQKPGKKPLMEAEKLKELLNEGLRELDTAILGHFDEQYDGRVYPRGWGLKGYHPHIGLADYLSRYGNCRGAQSELRIAWLPKDEKEKAALTRRITEQCAAAAGDMKDTKLGWSILARAGSGAGESELLPPFNQALLWTDLSTFR
jgi:hypothetical protein